MSIYKGTTLIAGGLPVSGLPLFFHTFSDHLFNNASWLRSDTFSWQDGSVYVSAYNHLVDDIDGITATTETVAGTTITVYVADDGHKIVLADQESNVSAIYTATGVGWYYILDTVNTRFKLPRSKWNFVGLRDTVGNYVAESLPNITAYMQSSDWSVTNANVTTGGNAVISETASKLRPSGSSSGSAISKFGVDASLSSSTYQNDAPVQQRATQAYLYFYVGNTVQDQTTIDVGQITDALNGKVDIDFSNVSATGKNTSISWGLPDYSAGVSYSNGFVVPEHGVLVGEFTAAVWGYCQLLVNNTVIQQIGSEAGQRCRGPLYVQVSKGDVVNIVSSGDGSLLDPKFYPYKGV